MSHYYVEVQFRYEGASPEQLNQLADVLMDALMVEPNLIDPDVGMNLETGTVDVCVAVEEDDQPGALQTALVAVRSAVHASGGNTAGWEDGSEQIIRSTVRPSAML